MDRLSSTWWPDSAQPGGPTQLNPVARLSSTQWPDSVQPSGQTQLNLVARLSSSQWPDSTQPSGQTQLNPVARLSSTQWPDSAQPSGQTQLNLVAIRLMPTFYFDYSKAHLLCSNQPSFFLPPLSSFMPFSASIFHLALNLKL